MRLIGQEVPRVEDDRILVGAGRYVDDVTLPGMVHAAFLRSPSPHGELRRVDVTAARAAPGVHAVFDGDDLAGMLGRPMLLAAPPSLRTAPFFPLARGDVRFVGDPIALVVANSRALAEDALERIEVDIDELPVVMSAESAPAEAVLHHETWSAGDVAAALAGAPHVVRETFRQSRQANVPMEPHGLVAAFDRGTSDLTVHAAHQNPHGLRFHLADLLDLPLDRVRVVNGDVGGSFGQKAYVAREYVAVALAARAVGRPVKWIEDRIENLTSGGHAREESIELEAGVDDDGRLLALRAHHVVDQGAYPVVPLPPTMFTNIVRVLLPGPYRLSDYECTSTIVATNKASHVAYRGPWEIETWGRERLLDTIARTLGLDPVGVRLRNLLTAAELPHRMVTGPTISNVDPITSLDTALGALAGIDEPPPRPGRRRGRGVAVVLEPAPGPPDYGPAIGAPRGPQHARIRLEPDGRVVLFTSQAPHGQSHETTLAQVAAEELGVELGAVRVVHGDTARTPFALVGTGGSRAASFASGAVATAARALRPQILAVAAELLEASPDDLDVREGAVVAVDAPDRSVPLADVARAAYVSPMTLPEALRHPLEADADFSPGEGGWSFAVHACAVDVEVDTGLVDVVQYVVAEDCGRVIHPAVVAGQIRGGVAMGIAGVLYEHAAYGDDGQPRATTFIDYVVPTAQEIPAIEVVHVGEGSHPLDIRGVGEGGAIGAPAAVTGAIEDALAPLGVRIRDQHLPPWRIVELIREAERATPAAE